ALMKEGAVTLNGVHLASEDTDIKTSGRIVLGKNPALDLSLTSKLDLALLGRLGITGKNRPSGEAEISGKVKGVYPDLNGSGNLVLRKVEYAGVRADDIKSAIEFEKGILTMPSLDSRILGGEVTGRLTLDTREGALGYTSSWTIKDVISGLYTGGRKDIGFIPWQRVSGSVDVSGKGFSAKDIAVSGDVELAKYDKPYDKRGISHELETLRDVKAAFRISDGTVTVEKGTALSAHSAVDFTGTVGFDGESDIDIRGSSGDISEISTLIGYSDTVGKLDLTAHMRGNITEPEIVGKAHITDASAHGIPFSSARGDVKLSGWQLSFGDFQIFQSSGSFLLNGKIMFKGEGASFDNPYFIAKLGLKKVDVRRIVAIFYEDIPLNLHADGELDFSGTANKFRGAGQINTGPGDVYGQAVDKAEVSAVLSDKDISFPKIIAAKGRDIVTASGAIGFDGTFRGKAASAKFDIASFDLLAKTGIPLKGSVSFSMTGGGRFDHPDISGNVSAFKLSYQDVDLGASNLNASIKGPSLSLNGTILDGKVGMDAVLGLQGPYAWRGKLAFNGGRFEPFLRLAIKDLPDDVSLLSTGVLRGEGTLATPANASVWMDFSKVSGAILGRKLENDGDISLSYRNGRLDVKSLKLKGEAVKLEVTGGATGLEQVDISVKASAELDIIKPLIKDNVDYIDGTAGIELKVRGGLKNPNLTGRITVGNAGIKFKDLAQRFDKISAEADFEGNSFTLSRFNSEFGGGKVSIKGSGGLKGLSVDSFLFNINAQDVKVKYIEGLATNIDADMRFEGVENQKSLSGEVTVKKARYTERIDWKSWLVQIQRKRPEVPVEKNEDLGQTGLDLHITAAETIKIDNNVAKIPISSDILLRGTINRPVILGRLESNSGSVYFRNNNFKLINGVVEFADPRKLNPIVDIQAETKVKDYTIDLNLSGTLDKIKATLNSDPPLDDGEIITLLTLGRTSEALQGHESAVTTGEATSFVTGQIQDAVEDRLKLITGFDRFQIDPYLASTGTSSGPRLTVGKSLFSDKLYMTYSSNVGTSEDQVVNFEYIFNKNLSLVGGRDDLAHYGADVKFHFEFK
ncbi:MAG: translocation/assembly module TamB domain-containing protein, partial [Nitrospirota bacterium]